MTDPESVAPQVLQNLLHKDLNIRKEGLKQLKEQWNIKFREYLWKAIEQEKHKSFQAEMVKFALMTLRDKSLRKMIRFVEKDQLYPRSRNYLITTYIEEETDVVREALIKSLKRERSQTYRFVCALLQDGFLTTELSRHEIQSLVRDILQEGIPDRQRQEMLVAVMNRYFAERYFQNMVRPVIWELIDEYPFLHFVILRVYFNAGEELDLEIVKPKKHKPKLMWEDWDWIIPGSNQDFNEYQDIIGYNEELVLNARVSGSPQVRQEFIKVMTHQSIQVPPPAVETDNYLSNLYQVWDKVVKYRLEAIIKDLDVVTGEVLQEIFDQPLADDDTGPTLYGLLQTHQINPHDLIARVIGYLPRTLLLDVARSDPDQKTQVLAIARLNTKSFYLYSSTRNETALRGPPQFWMETILYCMETIQQELSTAFYDELTAIVFSLIGYLSDHQESMIYETVQTQLQKLEDNIEQLAAYDQALPIYYKLMAFLESQQFIIPTNTALTDKQKLLLLDDFIHSIDSETSKQSMVNLIDDSSYEVLDHVRIMIDNIVEDVDADLTKKEKDHLEIIIEDLITCDDVRVRTKSHLLQKRFNNRWRKQDEDQ